jgi:hypothetical protein
MKNSPDYTAIVSKFGLGHSQRFRFAEGAAVAEAGHVQEHGRWTLAAKMRLLA